MTEEMEKKMQEMVDRFMIDPRVDQGVSAESFKAGFIAAHDLMQAEVDALKEDLKEQKYIKVLTRKNLNKMNEDRDEWKAQAEKLADTLMIYADEGLQNRFLFGHSISNAETALKDYEKFKQSKGEE